MTMLEILASVLAVLGAVLVLSVAVAQFRARDAVSRINALGPATALGLPLILVAAALGWTATDGFDLMLWAKTRRHRDGPADREFSGLECARPRHRPDRCQT